MRVFSDKPVNEKKDNAQVHLEMERVKKWLKMTTNWNSASTRDKLRKRVFKGVPDSMRGRVWSRMLNLATVGKEQSGVYRVIVYLN